MEARLLEFFLRVVELGSINRAAPTLGLSQPALSRHVAALEHEVKTTLFTRTQGGVRLTDAGRFLADRAPALLRQLTLLKEQVGEQAAGQLAVGMPPAWHVLVAAPFAAAMAVQHPSVKLRLYEGLSNVLKAEMSAGLLDFGIVPFSQAPLPNYQQTALVREPLVLIGDAAAGLDPGSAVPLDYLEGKAFVLPERPNILRVQLEHALERKAIALRVVMESDTLQMCLDMASRGVAYTVVPASALASMYDRTATTWAPLRGQGITWAVWDNKARTHSQVVREGRRLALRHLNEAISERTWWGASSVGTPASV